MDIRKANLKWDGVRSKRKKTTEIIIHCSATPQGRNYTVEQIHNMHLQKSWVGIGYNYYIDLNGVIWEGRGEEYIGAHTSNHNSNSIGICYCGGCAADGKTAKDTRTAAQTKALIDLIKYLQSKYPNTSIHGHNEFAAKACPSFDVQAWLSTGVLSQTEPVLKPCLCGQCVAKKECTKKRMDIKL